MSSQYFGVPAVVRRLVEVAGRAELGRPHDALLQPPGPVDDEVALPDHELGGQLVEGRRREVLSWTPSLTATTAGIRWPDLAPSPARSARIPTTAS